MSDEHSHSGRFQVSTHEGRWFCHDTGIGPLQIIGSACGQGSPDNRCSEGPEELHRRGILAALQEAGIPVRWRGILRPGVTEEKTSDLETVTGICEQLATAVSEVVADHGRFAVIGGDHSCAVGTWSGVHRALAGEGRFGLVWLDAHMDSHTPATSRTGALHGMPLACLLGFGPPSLINITRPPPALLPQHVCLVGVRSFEPPEDQLLARLGVRVFSMNEVSRRGLASVLAEATDIVSEGTLGFGLSMDLDVIDPEDIPAVTTPSPGGLKARDCLAFLRGMGSRPGFLGVEIAEFNPARDRHEKTVRLIPELLAAIFTGQLP